jgi:tetratricopeptide (TPR) repeat protein
MDSGIRELEKALEIDPSANKARELLSMALSERSGNISENTEDKTPEMWIAEGLAHTLHNNDDEEAIKCFDKAIDLDQNNDAAWYQKGIVFFNMSKHVAAIECFDKAIELNPNEANYWTGKANSLTVLEKKEEAIKCYDKALELNSEIADIWYFKGRVLGMVEKYYEANECYSKSLELEPNNSEALAYLGITYILMEKYEEAINCINKAIKLEPNNTKYNDYLEKAYSGLEKKQPGISQEITGKVRLTRFGSARLSINPHSQKKLSDSDWYKFLSVEIDYPSPIVRSAFLSAHSYEQIWVALWDKEDMQDSDAHIIAEVNINSDGTYQFVIDEDEKKETTRKISEFASEIRRLDTEHNKKFDEAGNIAYKEYLKNKPDQPPAVVAKWNEIEDIDSLIAKNKQDLSALKQREKKTGFLAKLGDSIASTAKTGKLKLDVHNLERKRDSVITEFGSVLYDSHKKGDNTLDELSTIWQEIADIERQIGKNEEEIASLRKYV